MPAAWCLLLDACFSCRGRRGEHAAMSGHAQYQFAPLGRVCVQCGSCMGRCQPLGVSVQGTLVHIAPACNEAWRSQVAIATSDWPSSRLWRTQKKSAMQALPWAIRRPYLLSAALTAADTSPMSALPESLDFTAPITLPMSPGPVAPTSATIA